MAKKNTQASSAHITKGSDTTFFRKYAYEIAILIFSLLLYSNSITNYYNMDDELVTINHRLTSKGITAIPEIFSSPYYSDESGYAYEYRPIVLSTYAIEHSLFGDSPHMSHMINILLYALCCLVLYKLLTFVFSSYSPIWPLAVTLLFIAHPAHTEVVCSAKNRDEILGMLFSLLSMLTALQVTQKKYLPQILLSTLFFVLALLSKITFIIFALLTPLALVFFTPASAAVIAGITLLSVVPMHFLLDLTAPFSKLTIEAGTIGGVMVLFLLIRRPTFSSYFAKSVVLQEKSTPPQSFWSNPFSSLSHFLTLPTLLCLLLVPVYILGMAWDNYFLLTIIPAIYILLTAVDKNDTFKIAKSCLYGCLTAGLLSLYVAKHIQPGWEDFVLGLLATLVSYELFFGKSSNRVVMLLCLLATIVSLVTYSPILSYRLFGLINYVLVFLFFFALKFRQDKSYSQWVTKAMHIAIVITILAAICNFALALYGVFSGAFHWYIFFPFFIAILVGATIHYQKLQKTLVIVLGILLLFLSSRHSPAVRGKIVQPLQESAFGAQNNVKNSIKKLDVKIYDVKTDRPLAFLESPINYTTSWDIRTGTSLTILFHYLYKVVLPYPMAFYYGYSFIKPVTIINPIAIASLIIHLAMLLLAIWLFRKNKILSFGIWMYLLSIAIYSNYLYPVPGMLADRFLLVPSLGWCILVIIALAYIFKITSIKNISFSNVPARLKYALGAMLLVYSAITYSRNFDWKDNLTLMRKDVKYVEESAQGHNLLALNLMKYSMTLGRLEEQQPLWKEAIVHFKKSLEIYPSTFNVAYDLGRVYSMFNETDSSLYYFQLANSIDPKNDFPTLKMNLGMIYQQKGLNDSALFYYQEYNRLLPTDIQGYDKLGYIHFIMGRKDLALSISKQATVNLPSDYRSYFNVARSYVELNQIDSALVYLRKAQQLNPNDQTISQSIQTLSSRR